MMAWLIAHEAWLKLTELLTLLAALSLLQWLLPRRGDGRIAHRWRTNLGLIAISTVLLRVIFPLSGSAFAVWLQDSGFGLLNQVTLGTSVEVMAAVLILDLAIYWQHRAFHQFPLLWRAHRVHHSDIAFDASLGLRFHPLEILPSMAYKMVVVAALGAAPIAVLVYEAMLLGFSLMTHGDVALSPAADRAIRFVFVTPDWHRVHHSVHGAETNSNYGNILSIWDRIFRTYIPQPRDGHLEMTIGLDEFRSAGSQTLVGLLRQPFSNAPPSSASPLDNTHA